MPVLARVTADVDVDRGPDLSCEVGVPAVWFDEAATIRVSLPRLLGCARCDGGGCDTCDRRGAFVREDCGAPEQIEVGVPRDAAEGGASVCLRLPESGALSGVEGQPPGHLLLTLRPLAEGEAEDERVCRLDAPVSDLFDRLADRAEAVLASPRRRIWVGLGASTILIALIVAVWLAT